MGIVATNKGRMLQALELPRSFILGGYVYEKANLYPLPVGVNSSFSNLDVFTVGGFRYSVYSGRVLNLDKTRVRPFSVVVDDKLETFVGVGYIFGSDRNTAIVPDCYLNNSNGDAAIRFLSGFEPDTLTDYFTVGYTFSTNMPGNTQAVAFCELPNDNILINLVYIYNAKERRLFLGYAPYDGSRTLTELVFLENYQSDVPLKYLGKKDDNWYLVGFILDKNDNYSPKVVFVTFDSGTLEATIDLFPFSQAPDFSIFTPATCGVYREDGSIYVPVLYRTADGWNADVFMINASDNSIGRLEWTLDTSTVDISYILPASGSYGWACDVKIDSNKGMLVHSLLIQSYELPPIYGNSYDFVMLLELDEVNGKLLVKDAKSYDATVARGVLPLNQAKDSFYVLGDGYISLLKLNGDSVLVYKDVDRAKDILGVDEHGRIWGSDANYVELLPIYEPYRRIELEFETPLGVTDSFPVDNNLIVKLYDENSNRISGSVELVVTTGNMLFKDTNSYKITVNVSDGSSGDTKVAVSITAPGEINVEGVVL